VKLRDGQAGGVTPQINAKSAIENGQKGSYQWLSGRADGKPHWTWLDIFLFTSLT
jgi:hypothetical protein